jgi:hypothetical protein
VTTHLLLPGSETIHSLTHMLSCRDAYVIIHRDKLPFFLSFIHNVYNLCHNIVQNLNIHDCLGLMRCMCVENGCSANYTLGMKTGYGCCHAETTCPCE